MKWTGNKREFFNTLYKEKSHHFLRLIEEYIILLNPPPPPSPQTQSVSAFGALAHGPWPSLAYGA